MLRFWSFDEQQRRKARVEDISELLETAFGTVFSSFDEWIADLERTPRYKPDRTLTKRWYKVRDFVPFFRNLASAHPPTEAAALLILDEFIVRRLTEGSIGRITEPEITAIVERGRLEPFMPHEAELFHFSGSKRQANRIFEVAEGMAALAPADEARRSGLERARLLLSL